MAWTQEKTDEVVAKYEEIMAEYETIEDKANATTEVVKELAEEFDENPNGVRIKLTQAGVYIKKAPTTKSATGGSAKLSKADAIQTLKNLIEAANQEVDEAILDKLTGKAATYFAGVLQPLIED